MYYLRYKRVLDVGINAKVVTEQVSQIGYCCASTGKVCTSTNNAALISGHVSDFPSILRMK